MIKKSYSNQDITVIWKPDVCIHSTKCWKASLESSIQNEDHGLICQPEQQNN